MDGKRVARKGDRVTFTRDDALSLDDIIDKGTRGRVTAVREDTVTIAVGTRCREMSDATAYELEREDCAPVALREVP